jgi:hypothetical protein
MFANLSNQIQVSLVVKIFIALVGWRGHQTQFLDHPVLLSCPK